MVECPLHGSEHEPWQCPEHTKHALQEDVMADVTKKSALDYAVELRRVKVERDRLRKAVDAHYAAELRAYTEMKKWRDYARGLEAQRDRLRKAVADLSAVIEAYGRDEGYWPKLDDGRSAKELTANARAVLQEEE